MMVKVFFDKRAVIATWLFLVIPIWTLNVFMYRKLRSTIQVPTTVKIENNRYDTTNHLFYYGQNVELKNGFFRGCKAAVVDWVPPNGYTIEVYSGLWFGENAIGGSRHRKPPILIGVPETSLKPYVEPSREYKSKTLGSSEA